MVGFWLVMLSTAISFLVDEVGGVRALLLTLLIVALGQMGYGVLCRRMGKPSAGMVYRFGPLLLLPGMFLLNGAGGHLTTVVFDVCQLLAVLDWSDDDIGGWGRRRWAQMRSVVKRFSRPVMGGVTPRV